MDRAAQAKAPYCRRARAYRVTRASQVALLSRIADDGTCTRYVRTYRCRRVVAAMRSKTILVPPVEPYSPPARTKRAGVRRRLISSQQDN